MANGIAGVSAAGRQPTWVIQASALTDVTSATKSIPLTAVTGGTKIDCYHNFGGVELTREQTTTERQRACEKVAQQIKIGETINGNINAVWDQQASSEAEVNKAYGALPEGADVFLFVANGHDTDKAPDAQTKGDLWRVKVSQVDHTIAAAPDEDLMFRATLSGSLFLPNITLTA
ncbi:hypothetical protein [Rothia nasimurium]|uniref:phage tail tube protein n=1 Tax=Rothia nasimurium TaxID=85336 RepID=UPI001F386495|nr:hypothetical protein [Rothia nasimurium]